MYCTYVHKCDIVFGVYSCSDDDTENVPMSGTTSNDSVVATFLLHSLEGVHTEGYVAYM